MVGYRGIDRDVTERKRFEDALRVSEEKFSKAFQNSPAAVTLTRLSDGTIADANNSALELFRFSRKEVLGRTTLELKMWAHDDDRDKLVKELQLKGSVHNQELTLHKKDGTYFNVTYLRKLSQLKESNTFYLHLST